LDLFIGSNPDIDIKNIIIHSGPWFEEHERALTSLLLLDKNFTGYHTDVGKPAWSCFQKNAYASAYFSRFR